MSTLLNETKADEVIDRLVSLNAFVDYDMNRASSEKELWKDSLHRAKTMLSSKLPDEAVAAAIPGLVSIAETQLKEWETKIQAITKEKELIGVLIKRAKDVKHALLTQDTTLKLLASLEVSSELSNSHAPLRELRELKLALHQLEAYKELVA